ncbi:SpoIIIAH-like family protein [Clostridium saudiense]|nr:SpoIIIAH-like family protein [Clostridium saudiense]
MGENKIICPDCGKENKKGNILCSSCGKVLQNDLAQARIDKPYPKYDFKNIKTNFRSNVKNKQLSIIVGAILCISIVGTVIYSTGNTTDENNVGLSADLSALLLENDIAEETMSNQGFFYNDRANKIKSDTEFKEEMTAIIEDTTSSQEVIDNATNLLNQKIQAQEQETAIETEILNNGYEDALCMIDTNIVRVYVKSNDTFTEENASAIQNIVEGITGLTDIQVESRN